MFCVRWYSVMSLVSIAVATDTRLEVGSVHTDLDDFHLGVVTTLLVVAVAAFLCRCAPRCSRLVGGTTLVVVSHPFLRVLYGVVWQLAETVVHEFAWTVGIGYVVRLGIAYAMPVAAVTTIELALGLVFFCVTAAVMAGGGAPFLLGGGAPLLLE